MTDKEVIDNFLEKLCAYKEKQIMKERKRRIKAEATLEAAGARLEAAEGEIRDHAEWAERMMIDPCSEPYRKLEQVIADVEPYIQHLDDCDKTLLSHMSINYKCTCGLQSILNRSK